MESDQGGHGDQVPAAPGLVRGRGDDLCFTAFVSMWNDEYEVHQGRVRELQFGHTHEHNHLGGLFSNGGGHGDQEAAAPGLVPGRGDDLDFADFGSIQEDEYEVYQRGVREELEFPNPHVHVDEFDLGAFISNEITITSSFREAEFEDGFWRWPEVFQYLELEFGLDHVSTDEAYGQEMFGAVPATRAAVEALEVKKYKEGIHGSGSDVGNQKEEMCAICQDKFLEGVDVACMPCSHVFHAGCLFPWLERSRLCPLCRHGLAPADQE